jgi:hypothetical protein
MMFDESNQMEDHELYVVIRKNPLGIPLNTYFLLTEYGFEKASFYKMNNEWQLSGRTDVVIPFNEELANAVVRVRRRGLDVEALRRRERYYLDPLPGNGSHKVCDVSDVSSEIQPSTQTQMDEGV